MERGRSIQGMIRLMPDVSVLWYFPKRSTIIVCACCTMRMPLAIVTITSSATAPTSMRPGPISALLFHDEGCAVHLNHRHPRDHFDRRVVDRGAAPVFAFHLHAPHTGSRIDPFQDDAGLAEQSIDPRPHIAARAELEAPHDDGTQTDHARQARGRECNGLHGHSYEGDEAEQPGRGAPHRETGEPEAGREHLCHDQHDPRQEPDQPVFHGPKLQPCPVPRYPTMECPRNARYSGL